MTTILVVDDSPVIRRMLSHTLKKNKYTVLTAENGKKALAQLDKATVDLLITDVTMPQMDGLELLKRVRAHTTHHTLPVVMLTASAQQKDYLTAQSEGADGFLNKPTSSRELIETVQRLIKP